MSQGKCYTASATLPYNNLILQRRPSWKRYTRAAIPATTNCHSAPVSVTFLLFARPLFSIFTCPDQTRFGLIYIYIYITASYNANVCYPGTESERPRAYYQQSGGLSEPPYRVQPRTESRYPLHEGAARTAAYPPAAHVVPSQISSGAHEIAYHYPGQQHFNAIYTDDATTKLNDRIRRRCFNCCTTDTSTWRRSSLNPGKVVSTYNVTFCDAI